MNIGRMLAVTKFCRLRVQNLFPHVTQIYWQQSCKFGSDNDAHSFVEFETFKEKGIITLNRPRKANSLNMTMLTNICNKIIHWKSSGIKLIIIKAKGKIFSGGTDVISFSKSDDMVGNLIEYLRIKSQLTTLIATLSIPYISLINGPAIGNGVALVILGKIRVATERTYILIPNTAMGSFPMDGTTYILARLPGRFGYYLALTSKPIQGIDIYNVGLATHMCASQNLDALVKDLISLNSNSSEDIDRILQHYHEEFPENLKLSDMETQMENIRRTFYGNSIEQIIENLKMDSSDWSKETVETLEKMSPTCLKVNFKCLQMGEQLSLLDCLKIEKRFPDKLSINDFSEGIQAFLHKDHRPRWKPNTLNKVTPEIVNQYFI